MQQLTAPHANNFNLLRLIGAASVVFSHTYDIIGKSDQEPFSTLTKGIFEISGIGLSIFFFISGYFVTKSAAESKSVFSFLRKRIFRIYPALIVLILISVFIAGPLLSVLPVKEYFSNKDTWMYLYTATGLRIRTNLPGVFSSSPFFIKAFNASLWSITLEIQLYLSLAFFLITGLLKNKKIFSIITSILILSFFAILAFKQNLFFPIRRQLNLVSLFYIGSLVYTISLKEKYLKTILLFSAMLYLLFMLMPLHGFNPFFLLLIVLALSIYFTGFTKKTTFILKTDISYGLYIYAFPVQQILFKLLNYTSSPSILLITTFAVVVPLAITSWHLIEKPCIALKYMNQNTERFFIKFDRNKINE